MALLTIDFWSSVLDKWTQVLVFLNDKLPPPYPTLYLLHGLAGNHTHWTRYTTLETVAKKYPFMIIMPDCARSFYLDSPLGPYESYLTEDLVPWIDRHLPARANRQSRAVGGLSMGGYGALKLAFKRPDLFAACVAHSAATHVARQGVTWTSEIPEVELLSRSVDLPPNDLWELSVKCPVDQRPQVYLDCGRKDFLLEHNLAFHQHLEANGIPHEWHLHPGEHTWSYWNEHLPDGLHFLQTALGLGDPVVS